MDDMTFAEKLRLLMKRDGTYPAAVAREAGVSQSTVGRWVKKNAKPYDDAVIRVARYFGVPLDYLLDDNQDDPPIRSEDEEAVLSIVRELGYSVARRRLLGLRDDGRPINDARPTGEAAGYINEAVPVVREPFRKSS